MTIGRCVGECVVRWSERGGAGDIVGGLRMGSVIGRVWCGRVGEKLPSVDRSLR